MAGYSKDNTVEVKGKYERWTFEVDGKVQTVLVEVQNASKGFVLGIWVKKDGSFGEVPNPDNYGGVMKRTHLVDERALIERTPMTKLMDTLYGESKLVVTK